MKYIAKDIENYLFEECFMNNNVECCNCANEVMVDGKMGCYLGYIVDMIEGREEPMNKKRSWNND